MSATIAYYGGIVTDGLVLYMDAAKRDSYPGFGTNWNSVARGSSISGSLINGVAYNSNSGSLQFDGINDYINHQKIISTSNAYCMWTQWPNPTADYPMFFMQSDNLQANGNGFYAHILGPIYGVNKGKVVAFIFTGTPGASTRNDLYSTNILSYNTWYYLVWQWSDSTKVFQFYLNGVLNNSMNYLNSVTTSTTISQIAGVGSDPFSNYFKGTISNVQVYNRALSASEVLQNYNATKGRFGL